MATSKSKPTPPSLRASQREGVVLDCSASAFRDLMVEQSKGAGGKWTTFYLASRDIFVAAGLPENIFPLGDSPNKLKINGQPARITRKGVLFELELHWPEGSPWYHSAGHPAIAETERMVRCSVGYWLGCCSDDELPVSLLADSQQATDYHLPASKRFKLARGQKMMIYQAAEYLYQAIHHSEIMPIEIATPKTTPPRRENVIDISNSKKLTRKTGGRAHG